MEYYNEIAKGYNELHEEEQLKKVEIIKKNIKVKGLLLDIGSGTGISTKPFLKKAKCIALDPAIKMLKQFSGLKVCGKAEYIPFKDNAFDTIISVTALHHTDIKKALREIKRVSKKNAEIAITIFKKADIKLKGFKEIDEEKDKILIKHAE